MPINQNVPPSSGQPGVPCTTQIGGICTISGPNLQGSWTKTGSGTFTVTATGPVGTVIGGLPAIFLPTTAGVEGFQCGPVNAALQTTCTGATVGNLLQGATVTVRFPLVGGGTADVTGTASGPGPLVPSTLTPTPTSLSLAQALALVQPSGQPGPCASAVGQTCSVTGGVTGSGTVTGSMTWTLTAPLPAGVAAGIVPVAVFATTAGLEGFPCAATVAWAATVACNGTTADNARQGSTVTVVFAAGVTATGVVSGPGVVLALLPPPPIVLPPPPPPPLVPLPPSAPPVLASAPPEVPQIPESDSLLLLGFGLATLGLVTRPWRRR